MNYQEETQAQYAYMEYAKQILQEKYWSLGLVPTYHVTTFGCQMNSRDSEKLEGILQEIGFEYEENEEEADFVIFNTCTVRDNANQRVYGRLGHLKKSKSLRPLKKVALCGCMIQEESVIQKIKTSYPYVDLLFGTHNLYKFAELLVQMYESDRMVVDVWKQADQIVEDLPVARKYAFKSGVNITYGCNNFCSYCIVPYVRGRERSRKPEDILHEVKKLVDDGVIEIMLLGQNVNSYGNDLDCNITFPGLLASMELVEGLQRVRFMTPHPKDLSDELISVMATSRIVCKHIHLPLQSGSTRILEAMNRKYTKESYLALIERIRSKIPDIAITTDLIVGFPGETAEDVEETMDVVRRVGYDHAFTFQYSKRTGTPAASMPNQVSKAQLDTTFSALLKVVQETAHARSMRFFGTSQKVLVEAVNDQKDGYLSGRMDNNSVVHFPGDKTLIGKIVTVNLTESHGFYYLGEQA